MVVLSDRWIGLTLSLMRAERGIEQQEIAANLGWSAPRVSHIEHARVNIRALDLDLYAQQLGVTVSDVLDRARSVMEAIGEKRWFGHTEADLQLIYGTPPEEPISATAS